MLSDPFLALLAPSLVYITGELILQAALHCLPLGAGCQLGGTSGKQEQERRELEDGQRQDIPHSASLL